MYIAAFQWLFAKQNCLITKPFAGGVPWTLPAHSSNAMKNPGAAGNPIGAASFSPTNNSRQIQFWTHHNTQTQSQMGGANYGGVGFWAGADRKAGPVATENGVSEQHLAIVRQPVLSPFPNYIVHTGHWYASLFFFRSGTRRIDS